MTDKYGVKFSPISLRTSVTQVINNMRMDRITLNIREIITRKKFTIKALIAN